MLERDKNGRFVKGSIPWNKGKYIRINIKGEFKKGHIPWNKGKKGEYSLKFTDIKKRKERARQMGLRNKGRKHTQETINKLKNKSPPITAFKKGHRPWNYIDGRSKNASPARYGDDWERVRYLVYLRDGFTCQECGIRGISLDVHHKIPFLVSFDNSLSNLITLCRSCHMKREKRLNKEIEICARK